jgi:hypothetical protein
MSLKYKMAHYYRPYTKNNKCHDTGSPLNCRLTQHLIIFSIVQHKLVSQILSFQVVLQPAFICCCVSLAYVIFLLI